VKVQVTGGAAPSGASDHEETSADTVAVLEGELGPLRSIHRRSSLSTRHTQLHASWWFLLLLAVAPLGFLAMVLVQGIRRRRDASRGVVVSRRAAGAARKALHQVSAGSGAEGHAAVAKALNGFLKDRFGEPASGLTREELLSYLTERGVEDDLAQRTAELLETCERARYAPGEATEAEDELASRAGGLVGELDRAPAGGGNGGGGA